MFKIRISDQYLESSYVKYDAIWCAAIYPTDVMTFFINYGSMIYVNFANTEAYRFDYD